MGKWGVPVDKVMLAKTSTQTGVEPQPKPLKKVVDLCADATGDVPRALAAKVVAWISGAKSGQAKMAGSVKSGRAEEFPAGVSATRAVRKIVWQLTGCEPSRVNLTQSVFNVVL